MTVTRWAAAERRERVPRIRRGLAPGRAGGAPKPSIPGSVILGLVIVLSLAACVPDPSLSEKAILGQWVNSQGGTIYFYPDQSGFIPGDEGSTPSIPSVAFTYRLEDSTHLAIALDEQETFIVKIQLKGDKMIWYAPSGGIEFVYTRAR